jgi:peroxiredoxin
MLEKNGVRIAAVSYDSEEILRGFAEKYAIGFSLLSDRDSAVIRRFGILNTNISSEL